MSHLNTRPCDAAAEQEEYKSAKREIELERKAEHFKEQIEDGQYDQALIETFVEASHTLTKDEIVTKLAYKLAEAAA